MTPYTEDTDKAYFDAIEAGHKEADELRALADRIEAVGPYYNPELSIHEMELQREEGERTISERFARALIELFQPPNN